MTKKLVPVLLCALASPAIAQSVDHRNLSHAAGWAADVKAEMSKGSLSSYSTAKGGKLRVEQCKAVLEDLAKQGMKTVKGYEPLGPYGGKKIDESGYKFEITLEQGEKVCADVQYWAMVLGPYEVLSNASNMIWMAESVLDQSLDEEGMARTKEQVAECHKQVDALIAAKVPATQPYIIKAHERDKPPLAKTVGELKAGVCDRLGATVVKFNEAMKAAEEAKKAPYIKAGINDDKLWLMLTYGNGVILPGGRSTSDLKVYAKSSVLFLHLSGDPDGLNIVTHTVRKHKFKGNKLVDQTEKTYRKKYGERLPNSAFK